MTRIILHLLKSEDCSSLTFNELVDFIQVNVKSKLFETHTAKPGTKTNFALSRTPIERNKEFVNRISSLSFQKKSIKPDFSVPWQMGILEMVSYMPNLGCILFQIFPLTQKLVQMRI